jgi:hypothetical protein
MRVYSIINYVILSFIGYFFTLPLYSDFLYKHIGNIWTCPYNRIVGKACPLCGITSDIPKIFNSKPFNNEIIVYVLLLLALETIGRLLILWYREKIINIKNIMIIDLTFHIFLISFGLLALLYLSV